MLKIIYQCHIQDQDKKDCASKLLDGVINKNGSARGVIYHKWEHFLDKRLLKPPPNFSPEVVLTNDDDLLDRIREIKEIVLLL